MMRVIFRFKYEDNKEWVGFTFCVPFSNDPNHDGDWEPEDKDREIGEWFWMAIPDIDGPEWETRVPKEWREYLSDGRWDRYARSDNVLGDGNIL